MSEAEDRKNVGNVKDELNTMIFNVCKHSSVRILTLGRDKFNADTYNFVIEMCNTCNAVREIKVKEAPRGTWQMENPNRMDGYHEHESIGNLLVNFTINDEEDDE